MSLSAAIVISCMGFANASVGLIELGAGALGILEFEIKR